MSRRTIHPMFLTAVVTFVAAFGGPALAAPVALTPTPRQVTWSTQPPLNLDTANVALVVGRSASEPELYAAQQLHNWVQKRFGVQWPIVSETDAGACDVAILLGQRNTHGRLDALCRKHDVALATDKPGFDGYVLRVLDDNGRPVILVGGSNARGVVYGQDTLVQLIDRRDGRLVLHRASIDDAPAVPWRGRPQTTVQNYMRPDELDTYLTARMNFIDLREGIYAFEPGAELDKPVLAEVLREAHRRGLVVYGVVNCGVDRRQYDAAMSTYKELIALGVDGLWLSFDDKGPGTAPEELTHRVLQLGRAHGMTGSRIMICPPKGSYQVIANDANRDFNRKIVAVPGMEHALWFWTCVPTPAALEEARSIGLEVRPSWWHNWPRLKSQHNYLPIPPLALGWNGPTYDMLADCHESNEAIMPWGGNAWGAYYIAPTVGWWGWNPRGHDWNATRHRIYEIVYGPGQAENMRAFDDTLDELKTLLIHGQGSSEFHPQFPGLLQDRADRPHAVALLEKMDTLLTGVENHAAGESMLGADHLASAYLQPARKELEANKAMATLPFPEYWWQDHQRAVLTAIYDGQDEQADALIASVRDRVLDEIRQAEQQLAPHRNIGGYVQWWRHIAERNAADWRQLVEKRRTELAARTWEYGYFFARTDHMLEGIDEPPMDWGTGRWEWMNTVQATVLPTEREMFWGGWVGGTQECFGQPVIVFASHRKADPTAGEFSELEIRVPVSGRRDMLALMLYASHVCNDTIGGDTVPLRWSGHRFLELRWGDELLWELDLGPRRIPGDWFVVPLPEIPADMDELTLHLRATDRRLAVTNRTIVFVSPIRLVEMPVFDK